MKTLIFHNAKCQKSRKGLQYIKDKKIEPEIIEYLKDKPFTDKSLKEIIKKLGVKPFEIVRTQESDFKKKYKGKNLSDDQWIKVLIENPKLIRRPIIVKGDKAVLGDIVEHIDTLL
jgi:arsenate reductase (glutaredoxin)